MCDLTHANLVLVRTGSGFADEVRQWGLLADEARGYMAFMCMRGSYALILGSRTRGQPVCLTMGDVMLGGTMGVVMLGSTWLAQYSGHKTKHRLLVLGRFDFTSNAARGIFYDCFEKGTT